MTPDYRDLELHVDPEPPVTEARRSGAVIVWIAVAAAVAVLVAVVVVTR